MENLNIEEDFKIDENSVLTESQKLGHLLSRYATLSADARATAARTKVHYEEICARQALRARSEGAKLTEAMIKELLATSEEVKQAKEKLIQIERDQDMLDNLWRAMVKKADLIISILYFKREENRKGGY